MKIKFNRKPGFEIYKSSLEGTRLENKIDYLEKKIAIDSIKQNHKDFIKKNKKSILKIQQMFKSERHIFKNINVGIQFNDKQHCQKQAHFYGK